jgi:hypothetical protein
MTPCSDPLDNEEIWHSLILDYIRLPMNYGSNIGGVRPLARAAGIDPHRAVARVLAYYHHDASRGCNKKRGPESNPAPALLCRTRPCLAAPSFAKLRSAMLRQAPHVDFEELVQ